MGDASSMESQISLQNERHLHHPYVCEDQTSPVAHSTNEEENHKRQYKTENEDRHLLKLNLNEMVKKRLLNDFHRLSISIGVILWFIFFFLYFFS